MLAKVSQAWQVICRSWSQHAGPGVVSVGATLPCTALVGNIGTIVVFALESERPFYFRGSSTGPIVFTMF